MKKRILRWGLFAAALILFLWCVFVSLSIWSVAAFFACGGGWYSMTRRRIRELDALRRQG